MSTRVEGACTCGRKVTKEVDSPVTFRSDGVRYAYPETIDSDRWCIFRCGDCHEVISETFVPDGAKP